MSFTEGNDITSRSINDGHEGNQTLYNLNQRQLGLWILQQQNPSDYSYNVTAALKIDTTLKAKELAQIATRLFNIHPCAKTRFVLDKGVPKQAFDTFWCGSVNEYTVSRFEDGEALLRKLERTPFELTTESPARINLISCGSNTFILNLLIHHIIGDAKSGYIAANTLGQLLTNYFSGSTEPEASISVESYLDGIMDFDKDNPDALLYWENYLQNIELGVDISHLPRQSIAGSEESNNNRQHVSSQNSSQNNSPDSSSNSLSKENNKQHVPVFTKGNHERHWDFNLSPETTSQIKKLAKQCRATPFCVYTALFGVLINRCFRSNEFALGYIRDVRRKQDTKLAGFFIEQIPLALQFNNELSIESLIKQVKQDFSDHKKIGGLATGKVFQHLQTKHNKTAGKLNFLVSSTILETHNVAENLEEYDCRISTLPQSLGNMESDLSLMMDLYGQTARFRLYFNSAVFNSFTIQNLESAFRLLIKETLAEPSQLTQSVPLISATQQAEYGQGVQYHSRDLGRWKNMAELFSAKCQQQPHALAVIDKERQYTYREIDQLSNLVAHKLSAKGIQPSDSIAICMDRSMALMVSILGVLKTGATYVPLSPSLPQQRIAIVLEDSNIQIAITQSAWVDSFPAQTTTLLMEDALAEALHQRHLGQEVAQFNDFPIVTSNPLALVLYTSGSTGRPKGVEIPHLGVLNTLEDMLIEHPIVEGDIFLCRTSISFDCSLLELFGWFMGHGAVFMLAKEHELDIKYIINCINQHKITQSFFVPSLLTPIIDHLLEHPTLPAFPSMKVMYAAGEKFPVSIYEKITCLPMEHMALENKFGPTEASIYCTGFNVRSWQRNSVEMPIGRTVSNMRAYVLDEHLQPLPPGFAGELCLSGIGLAAGYRNLPEKTAEVFISNPFINNTRLYRTGDWVRVMADDTLEILGRFDGQIKLRGQRIELGEIEDTMLRVEGVAYAAATVKTHGTGQLLVAYYSMTHIDETHSEEAHVEKTHAEGLPVAQLRTQLAAALPPYMVPQRFVHMDSLPLLTSEKVDRKTLQAMPLDDDTGDNVQQPSPDTSPNDFAFGKLTGLQQHQIEAKLLQIWRDVLQFPDVGVRDNFFEIGGHSLLILQVTKQIYEHFGVELSVAEFFRFPNIQEMANFLANSLQPKATANEVPVTDSQPVAEIDDIAVIGLACRFPGADNADIFWHNLTKGLEGIRDFSVAELAESGVMPSEYQQSAYVKRKGMITGAKSFDAALFGYSRREADIIDPQQRLLLEQAYHALEDAGYADISSVQNAGVYAGSGYSLYANEVEKVAQTNSSISHYQILVGNSADYVSTRIAYKLNLKGPAITLQTACSTSLVAIERACRDLQQGECDMALAGGVSLVNGVEPSGYLYRDGMILSPDGHCRAFDANAQGTVPSQGVGMVVLKPLKKAIAAGDHIRAIVKGAAINNDGNSKVGYTAPSIDGQRDVIKAAQQKAGIDPATISYIETHGTGTAMGDPIEIAALSAAFASSSRCAKTTDKPFASAMPEPTPPCAIGSVKTNLGHCDAAAGIAGFIKTVLCLEHRTLVPSLHFNEPNPDINLELSGFTVNTETRRWEHRILDGKIQPLRAGVSAFGIGGTNAHVVLEEAPDAILSDAMAEQLTDGEQAVLCNTPLFALLPVSAASEMALQNNIMQLQDFLNEPKQHNLQDVAFTLQTGRQHLPLRACAIAEIHSQSNKPLRFESYNSEKPDEHCQTDTLINPLSDYCLYFKGIDSNEVFNTYISLYRNFGPFTQCVDNIASQIQQEWRLDLSMVLRGLKRGANVIEVTPQPHIRELLALALELGFAHCLYNSGFQVEAALGTGKGQAAAACFSQSISLNAAVALLLTLPLTTTAEQTQAKASLMELMDLDLKVKAEALVNETLLESSFVPVYLDSKAAWLGNVDDINRQISRIDLTTALPSTEADIIFADPAVVNLRRVTLFEGVERGNMASSKASAATSGSKASNLQSIPNETDAALRQLYNMFAELWCRGATIRWHDLYQEKQPQRLPLPKYAFDSQIHWLPGNTDATTGTTGDMWHSIVSDTLRTMFANEHLIENVDFVARKKQLHEAALIYMGRIIKQLSPSGSSTEFNFNELDLADIPIQNHDLINDWVDALNQHSIEVTENRLQQAINSDDVLDQFEQTLRNDWASEREFIVRVINCGKALHECLKGERNILTVLTAEEDDPSSLNSLGSDDITKTSSQIDYCNIAMRSVLQTIVNRLPDDGSLRAVEIGGGSGYGTSVVLPEVAKADCFYHFTDISPLMLHEAEKKFAQYEFMDFAKLNIEQSPLSQGYQLHSYDVVIAVNSLHTARDIDETVAHVQQLLAPGGVLLLWEITQPQLDFGITEGFLMPPVYDNLRNRASPFISTTMWREKLHNHGFDNVELLTPAPNSSHSVMVAQAGLPKVNPAFSYRAKTDIRQKHVALQKAASTNANANSESTTSPTAQSTTRLAPVKKTTNRSAPEQVLEIWRNHLNVEQASPEDDFFNAGGESLMALGLIDDLNKTFSLDMPANILYETPTLGALTEYVVEQLSKKPKSENNWSLTGNEAADYPPADEANPEGETHPTTPEVIEASQFKCLVRLQAGTRADLPPIFLIHAAGGGLFIFSHLINALGEQYTVYGFESPPELTQNSISELADTYLDALLTQFPERNSFILGGHSFGPVVALEMANKLQKMDKEVEALLLIDPPGPGKMPFKVKNYADILYHLNDDLVDIDYDHMQRLTLEEQIDYLKTQADPALWQQYAPIITPSFVRTFKKQLDMLHDYDFTPFNGDAIYFYPALTMPLMPEAMYTAWRPLIKAQMQVVEVEGNHISMNDKSGAAIIAQAIKRKIEK